jgi:hypothetical protein
MPQPRLHSFGLSHNTASGSESKSRAGNKPDAVKSTDRAIEAALRAVPLPTGLLTRLTLLIHTIPGVDPSDGPSRAHRG